VRALSAAPGFWQAATQADFLRGEVDQLSIDEHGRLTLGPELTKVHDAAAPFVWTMVAAADGAWFLGTGNDGKVIKVDRNGRGSVFYDSTEMEVHALAVAPNGGLYVGTSPTGASTASTRRARRQPFFDPDDKYIWSLIVDRDGNVFAGYRATRASSTRSRPTERHQVLRVENRARGVPRVRSEPATSGRHRSAGPRIPR
jgi:hypothetical protein